MATIKIPEISARQRWLLCILYFAGVGIALLYYRFPEETLRRYLVTELSRRSPGMHVAVGQVGPLLPPGLVCYNVTIYHHQEVMAENLDVSIYPHWSSLLGLSQKARFSVRVADSKVDGTVRFIGNNGSADYEVVAQLDAVDIEEITAVKALLKRPVHGTLYGHVTVQKENHVTEAQAQLTMVDGRVGINMPDVDIRTLEWDMLKTELVLKEDRLELQRCNVSGNQFTGQISGTFMLRAPWKKSRMKLQATITPKAALMAQLKQTTWGPLLAQMQTTAQGVAVRLRGTVGKPSVSLK